MRKLIKKGLALLLTGVMALSLSCPALAAEPVPGLVAVEDGRCLVAVGGETVADFGVEAPVFATLTTTPKSHTLALVVAWGTGEERQKRTVYLDGAEELSLLGDYSLITLDGSLPAELAVAIPQGCRANSLGVSFGGPVTVEGEVNTLYLSHEEAQVTLGEELDALVYNYHDLPLEGGEGCTVLSSREITRRQQESWRDDRPAAGGSQDTGEPPAEPSLVVPDGIYEGVSRDLTVPTHTITECRYSLTVANGIITKVELSFLQDDTEIKDYCFEEPNLCPINEDGSFACSTDKYKMKGQLPVSEYSDFVFSITDNSFSGEVHGDLSLSQS
ncbi:MAG TPA: hypothetical protein H9680_00785 [Firmicutes bacterium]|nr:hypothetical protein [Bacillota bacterium]